MAGIDLTPGMKILFQGDSITDAGRRATGHGLGQGYAAIASSLMSATYPGLKLEFVNRGISGNRVRDLERRWTEDCVALKPDLVSIMIGVNETLRRHDSNDPTSTDDYEAAYRRILQRVKQELGAKVVMLEPFLVLSPDDRAEWRGDLDPKIQAVRRLAREFADAFVPLDGVFAAAALRTGPEHWAPDGVHPTPAGHGLIATEWLRVVTGRSFA